jgi:aldehyde dehydrogenase (NAD+)
MTLPDVVPNWIAGQERVARDRGLIKKLDPHTGQHLCNLVASQAQDVDSAISAAQAAQAAWAAVPPVQRGNVLHAVANRMEQQRVQIAAIVSTETGKSPKEALGETDGAIALARFYAGEGQRLYGRTMTSGVTNKYAMTFRQPVGIAGLIIAANTPVANVAWKVFPALICGNGVVLKAAEDTPATAWIIGKIVHEAGLPEGVLNIVQGRGPEAGEPLVRDPRVGVVSFTGSTAVGRRIAAITGPRLAKVSLELGGKNPLVVCDDADLDLAAHWIALSAFSNAGQRCASTGRIIVLEAVYDALTKRLVKRIERLRVGPTDNDDYGPVINATQLANMLGQVEQALSQGGRLLTGGHRLTDPAHADGYYMAPTLLENVSMEAEISRTELFGPIACLYRAREFADALDLANATNYGLTACIHTRSIDRAWEFSQKVRAGMAVVNAGTYGSEPHMPFGGVGDSGNGSREPGTEALDIYSDLKTVSLNIDPGKL